MKKILSFLSLYSFLICFSAEAQKHAPVIFPQPVSLTMQNGEFALNKNTVIVAAKSAEKEAKMLALYLTKLYSITLPVKTNAPATNAVELKLGGTVAKEGYTFQSSSKKVTITAATNQGLFYGIQTLLQLLPNEKKPASLSIPAVTISDFPRFSYRGMHLDVARHYFDTDFIKKYIDYLAYHKFNHFHWHLTDDQGWRIEIKKYPKLTSVGAYRNGTITGNYPGNGNTNKRYGGFYTQEQIKDIVRYAADRHITIIPEIEMPGHASAAIAAYPELSCFPDEDTPIPPGTIWAGSKKGKHVQQTFGVFDDIFAPTEYTFNFLQNVLDEVMALFPSSYIHIGGDEAPKTNWKRSAYAQQVIKEKNLKDEHGLQSYFIQHIEKYLNSKGRRIIGWDEILEGGLAPNATVMSWRGESGGIEAAQQNHDVLMTPNTYLYFDYSQTKNEDSLVIGGYLPLEKVYSYEPMPAQLSADEAKHILGAQANLWTEYIHYPSKVEYMVFPRMTALSEVVWSSKESKNWDRFSNSLPQIFSRYKFWGSSFSTAFYDLKQSSSATPEADGVLYNLQTNLEGAEIFYKRNTDADWHRYTSPLVMKESGDIQSYLTSGGSKGAVLSKKFSFNKATGKKISLTGAPSPSYPGSGAFTLVNGSRATAGLKDASEWLGFLGKDVEAIIDLHTPDRITQVTVGTLDQPGSWIYLPSGIEVFSSDDGSNFVFRGSLQIDPQKKSGATSFSLPVDFRARYVKVHIKNYGTIPAGMVGEGTPAWLFVDEIMLN